MKNLKRASCIVLCVVLIAATFCGCTVNLNIKLDRAEGTPAASGQAPKQNSAAAPTQAPATTAAPSGDATTAAPSGDATTAAPADNSGVPTTKAEILKLFTESANKIKTNATKVTRNYEDLQNVPEELKLPSALQAVGNPLLNQFLKKNETPVEYTGADIKANYPAQGQDYVTNATEADIAEATCTPDGSNYKVVLKFNSCTDPADGTACAGSFNTIRTQDVYDNVPSGLIQNFSATYHDAQIEATIDKATGNMTAATYTLPITLNVTAKVIVTLDATVGMKFIHDYTIEY